MVKDGSVRGPELIEICRKNDLEELHNWLVRKKYKKHRTPLNFLFNSNGGESGLLTIRDQNNDLTALHTAAKFGYEAICRTLIEHEAKLCTSKDKQGCLPLHLAVWYGHEAVVNLLCEANRSTVDCRNNAQETSLHLAAKQGHHNIVQALINNGADPKAQNARCETPLDMAARNGHGYVCKMLVAFCPDLAFQSAVECSSTAENSLAEPRVVYPIHMAAMHSHVDCIRMLILAGFQLDYVTKEGSALHVAARYGQIAAVEYLISEGIDPLIKDSSGRTVLEALEHLQEEPVELTQLIQSRERMEECKKLIKTYLRSLGELNTSDDSGVDGSPKEIVWRRLPSTSRASEVKRNGYKMPSPSPPYRFPDRPDRPDDLDPGSTISISTREDLDTVSEISPCSTNYSMGSMWRSRLNDGRTPRIPVTSPDTKARHASARRYPETMPAAFSVVRTNTLPTRGTILPSEPNACTYKPPPEPANRVLRDDGTSHTFNPGFCYDNVPENRQWNHECREHPIPPPRNLNRIATRSDGTQTLPTPKSRNRVPMTSAFAAIQENGGPSREEPTPKSTQISFTLERPREGSIHSTGSIERKIGPTSKPPAVPKIVARWPRPADRDREREDSLGMENGLDTREGSTFTFACSTLERKSSSPPRITYREGRAPLAMPEDMTRSTSNSIMESSMSPERTIVNFEKDLSPSDKSSVFSQASAMTLQTRSRSRNPSSAETIRIEQPILDPPSPLTSQSQIFDALVGQRNIHSRTSVTSESTVASSSSLPLVSQISTTPTSSGSPRREKENDRQDNDEMGHKHSRVLRVRDQTGRHNPPPTANNHRLNERAEWDRIERILGSFGGAVCRESVFASDFEPQVAGFLRDRPKMGMTAVSRSSGRASDSADDLEASTSGENDDDDMGAPSFGHPLIRMETVDQRKLTVGDWLCAIVGIPAEKAVVAGKILIDRGYDSVEHMKLSINKRNIEDTGIDKRLHAPLLKYLKHMPEPEHFANSFEYVSDWLPRLGMTDFIGTFIAEGLKKVLIVKCADLTEEKLKNMGISKPGHFNRILGALEYARLEEALGVAARRKQMRKKETMTPPPPLYPPMHHSQIYTFSAHYLGSDRIESIYSEDECINVIKKLKKQINSIVKTTPVQVEISIYGVMIFNTEHQKTLLQSYQLDDIGCMTNDMTDRNCLGFTVQDKHQSMAHVFAAITAEIAKNIIDALGDVFKIQETRQQPCPYYGQGAQVAHESVKFRHI